MGTVFHIVTEYLRRGTCISHMLSSAPELHIVHVPIKPSKTSFHIGCSLSFHQVIIKQHQLLYQHKIQEAFINRQGGNP